MTRTARSQLQARIYSVDGEVKGVRSFSFSPAITFEQLEMSQKPYEGSSRRLVLAFDCGTTFSGISYCLLNPGEIPKICNITRFVLSSKLTAVNTNAFDHNKVIPGKNM